MSPKKVRKGGLFRAPIFVVTNFVTQAQALRSSYRNRSSSVIWLWIMPLYFPLFTPYVVIIVVCKVFLQFVILRKASSLFLKIMSYSLSITYSFRENLISQTLMTLSRRSISRSICAPGTPNSSSPCVYHMDSSERTPEIPSLFLICEI